MKNILIFAGTTEGRKVSEFLSKNRIKHTVCVATKYGEEMIEKNEFADIHCDRMDEREIKSFLLEHTFDLVIDATHPYAFEVTRNIKQAIEEINGKVRYIRLMRDMGNNTDNEMIKYFNSNEECAKALTLTNGNILLTTGSKELSLYAEKIKQKFCGNKFDMCSIVSGKSGKCSENCKFCAQSSHYKTSIKEYPLLDSPNIFKEAKHNADKKVKRFSLGTSKLYRQISLLTLRITRTI